MTPQPEREDRPVILLSEPGRLPGDDDVVALAQRHGRVVERFDAVHMPSEDVLDRVEFLVPPLPHRFGPVTRDVLERTPALRTIQLLSAGTDHMAGLVRPGITLCSAAGVRDPGVAELALGLVLAAQRDLPMHADRMAHGAWERDHLSPGLHGKRVLIVGHGRIALEIGRHLAPFDIACTRVARTARDDQTGHVHAVSELDGLLPAADVLILILPLTSESRGLIDAAMLAQLPDGALVVNVGRGAVVETAALLSEVRAGRLRAALDVVDPEPLPEDHPLRDQPGAIVTPHVGGNTPYGRVREADLLQQQLERHLTGRPLENVVSTT